MRTQRAVVGAHVDRGSQRAELIDAHDLGRSAKTQAHVNGHALLGKGGYDYVASCGPAVMMKKVAAAAAEAGAYCEVSLERMMSCGFGACNTCNVETVDGMKGACMCGPVFDASKVVVF